MTPVSTLALAAALASTQPVLERAPVERIPSHDYYCTPIDGGSVVQLAVFHSEKALMIVIGKDQKGYVDSTMSGYVDMFSVPAKDGGGADEIHTISRSELDTEPVLQKLQVRFKNLVTMAADAIDGNHCIKHP